MSWINTVIGGFITIICDTVNPATGSIVGLTSGLTKEAIEHISAKEANYALANSLSINHPM
jgi:hypothetical protein